MPDERRVHPRIPVTLDGRWEGASGASLCTIGNLSLGGCYVRTPLPPSAEEKALVSLFLPGRGSMLLAGHVARVEPGVGFGMQFREMPPEIKYQLRDEIEQRRRLMRS